MPTTPTAANSSTSAPPPVALAPSELPILDELRALAANAPGRARIEGWRYLRELSAADRRDQIGALFAAGTQPETLDGAYQGLIVGKLFNVPEAALANPLLAVNPTWKGKTFDAESGTGFNRLIPLARYAMRVIAPLYRGLRRVGPEMVGFDFRYGADVGLVAPRIPVIALDYGVEEYRNPSVRTFPIKRTRDEIVELLPGLYLGRALLTMHSGEIRTIAHFRVAPLRRPGPAVVIELDGAVICVTGAARGIGRATAAELARRGARVWIGDLDTEEAARTADQIQATSMHLDVTKEDSLRKFWAAASADGPVRMLVNNAGIMRLGPFVEQSLEGHHQEVAVNLGGVINGMHVFLPDMLARNCGHIVNVASMAAKVTTPGIAVYCATKFAVAALSRAVRAEIAHTAVTVTTIMPAAVNTELTSGVSLDLQPTLQPEQVGRAIADTARRPGREVTVPRWLAAMGTLEEAAPERLLQTAKRVVTKNRPPGDFDDTQRRGYLDRIGR